MVFSQKYKFIYKILLIIDIIELINDYVNALLMALTRKGNHGLKPILNLS